jgi:hypothetical protein
MACAITGALKLDRKDAAAFGALHSWDRATDQFVDALCVAVRPGRRCRAMKAA